MGAGSGVRSTLCAVASVNSLRSARYDVYGEADLAPAADDLLHRRESARGQDGRGDDGARRDFALHRQIGAQPKRRRLQQHPQSLWWRPKNPRP